MTRARERGRSGRFGGEGDREVGTSSLAVSCWEDELGVVIFGEDEKRGREKRKRKRRRRGFCREGKEAGGASRGVGKLGAKAACFVDLVHDNR